MLLEKADFGTVRKELAGIFMIEGAGHCSNVYILDGGEAMIDTANVRGITNEIDEEYDISNLKHLFITHPHSDHIGGLMEILRFCNPRIYVHRDAVPYVRLGQFSLAQALRHFERDGLLRPVDGGEKVRLSSGRTIEVIFSPGHTMGDICLLDRECGSLFSGDIVMASDRDNAYLAAPDPITGNMDSYIDSVAGLFGFPFRHLFPGHGNPTLDDGGEHLKNTLFHLLGQVEKKEDRIWLRIGAALSDAGRPAEALPMYDRVLSISPDHPEAAVCKGIALVELSRFEEALELFNRVLDGDPSLEMALIGKGFALMGMGRREEALAIGAFRRKACLGF